LKKNNLILIAARLKSNRLRKKVIKKIAGKEIIIHLVDRLKLVSNVDDIIVCTSINCQDDPIVEICKNDNIKCFRGSEDDVMGRFIDAVDYFKYCPKNIIRVTGDNCLVAHELVDIGILRHISTDADVTILNNLPIGMGCEIINFNYFMSLYKRVEDPNSSEYMTWMLDRPDLCKIEKIIPDKDFDRPHYRLTCDTIEDFNFLKAIYEKLYKGEPINSLEILKFLDANQDLLKINGNVKQVSYDDVKDHINVNISNK